MSKVIKIHVASSFIDQIAYDNATMTLSVMFTNGTVTQYLHVGPAIFTKFWNAESKGKFWNERIKNKYESSVAA